MANMNDSQYRREVRMFRGEMSNTGAGGGPRSLKGAGFQWYKVKAEPGLSLYLDLSQLYLKAFRNALGTYKFYHEPDPQTKGGAIINATELQFVDSYNQKLGRAGLGYEQNEAVTVTLGALNNALSDLNRTAGAGFLGLSQALQRRACAFVVIGLVEVARFKDVEDHIVNGTVITDRNWPNHTNQAAVMIAHG
jgi:hypothetical protein